jgi:hypothetical protein
MYKRSAASSRKAAGELCLDRNSASLRMTCSRGLDAAASTGRSRQLAPHESGLTSHESQPSTRNTLTNRNTRNSLKTNDRAHVYPKLNPGVSGATHSRQSSLARHKVSGKFRPNSLKTNDWAMRSSTHFFESHETLPTAQNPTSLVHTGRRTWHHSREVSPFHLRAELREVL